MADTLKTTTVKGTFWSFVDSVMGSGVTFVVGLVLARLLSDYEYGLIGIVSIFIAIFNSIVDSGFSSALIRRNKANDLDYNTMFFFNLFLSTLLFIFFFFSAPLIASFFGQPQLILLIRVMSIIVIINGVAIIQRTLFIKRIDFKTQAKISLIASVTSGCIGIALALAKFGVWALAAQQISRQLLNTLFLWIYGRWWPKLQFSIKSFKELFGFGWKLLVSGLINTLWDQIYQVVIGKLYSTNTLGQYTRADQFAVVPSSNLTSVIYKVSYPVLSSIQDDNEHLKNTFRQIIKITMFVTFVLMLGLCAIAEPMIVAVIGEKWLPCVPFLQILCLYYIFYPLSALNLIVLQVKGRSDLFLKLEIIKKIIAVGPILLGVFINIYWMLVGSVVINFVSYLFDAHYSKPLLKYSVWQQIRDILPSFTLAALMAVIVYMLTFLHFSPIIILLIQLIIGAGIVLAVGSIFKMNEYIEIKNIILSFIRRKKNEK